MPDLPLLAVEPNRFTWEKAASEARDLGSDVSFAADLQEAGLGSAVGFLPMLDTKKMVDFSGKNRGMGRMTYTSTIWGSKFQRKP